MTNRRERYQKNLMHAGKTGVSEKRRFSMSKTRRVSLSIPLIDTRRMSHIIPHADESPSTAGHTPLHLLLQRNIVLALKVLTSVRLGASTRGGASMSSSAYSVSLCSGIHSIQSVFVISRYFQHFIFGIYIRHSYHSPSTHTQARIVKLSTAI